MYGMYGKEVDKPERPRILYVDASIIAAACGFANEEWGYKCIVKDVSDEEWKSIRDAKAAHGDNLISYQKYRICDNGEKAVTQAIGTMMARIKRDTGIDLVTMCMDSASNYRKEADLPFPYKGGRDPNHKPLYFQQSLDHIRDTYAHLEAIGYEGDDLLGSSHDSMKIMASLDKDMLQIPGIHYNWNKKVFFKVTVEEGLKNLAIQMLMGDKVDNIPGMKGVGIKKAASRVAAYYDACPYLGSKMIMLIQVHEQYRDHLRELDPSITPEELDKFSSSWVACLLTTLWVQHEDIKLTEGVPEDIVAALPLSSTWRKKL